MKKILIILFNLTSLSYLCCQPKFQGTKIVSEFGNRNCIELFNSTTRVVLEPNLGGRVLIYELHGNNILWINQEIEGKSFIPGKNYGDPGSGRFDIGPELTSRSHPQLWFGKWEGQITGPRTATFTSQVDSSSGVKLIRTFSLDADNSHLIVTQDIINMGNDTIQRYSWSRTFMEGGGISLIPKNPHSRYPRGYLIYRPKSVIDIRPAAEPNVSIIDGVIKIQGPPSDPKFVMDCSEGWLAYISLDNQLFIKRFPVFIRKVIWRYSR
jgi:hypothetical protein